MGERLLSARLLSGPETLSLSNVWRGRLITLPTPPCAAGTQRAEYTPVRSLSASGVPAVTCDPFELGWLGKPRWETFNTYIVFLFVSPTGYDCESLMLYIVLVYERFLTNI